MSAAMPDLTQVDNAHGPRPTHRRTASRRETILSLVEMLLQQTEDSPASGVTNTGGGRMFEDDKDVPTVNEHIQAAGAESFNKFHKRINLLDKELRNFANAARQLGSSAGILATALDLRTRLAYILHLYRINAADLFPQKLPYHTQAAEIDAKRKKRRMFPKLRKGIAMGHVARPVVESDLELEDFPSQFEALAKEIKTFGDCLNEFPEFRDEAVNASIQSFEEDLKYWASCLRQYEGQFRYPAVQRYLHDLTAEMGDHIDSITSTLSIFIEVGVPIIRFAQKHGATNLLNLSTVATFFSAVTATTLQFSYELPGLTTSPVAIAVNAFWFASLVFSIGAAVNSLLGLTWKQAMYRSPHNKVPWWVLIWIKRSPLVFLVLSVACFSIGLCCFSYASRQSHVTSIITTVLTAFTSFGLIAVSTWFASERWTFLQNGGKKWLSDVLADTTRQFWEIPGIQPIRAAYRSLKGRFKVARKVVYQVGAKTVSALSLSNSAVEEKTEDLEAGVGNFTNAHERDVSTASRPRTADGPPASAEPLSPTLPPGSPILPETPPNSPDEPAAPADGKQLWRNALRTVKMRSAIANASGVASVLPSASSSTGPRTPRRQRTTSSTVTKGDPRKKTFVSDDFSHSVVRSRVAELGPKLQRLEATQDIDAHAALVRHMQFSPDGKLLATSSWDRTSVIFQVGDPFTKHRTLIHAKGFVGQVAWSPSGKYLLTKLNRGMKVWTVDGVCQRTIDRKETVESITWFPGGDEFLSVEGNAAVKLDLTGKVLGRYVFGDVKLHDVAVTPDGQRLLGVGPLLSSPEGLKPSKSRGEKRLMVYSLETEQTEHQTPVLNDVRDVTLCQSPRNGGLVALVSYENKAPPQLWRMEFVRDPKNHNNLIARLTLRHTYMPKAPVDFAGPSYFGGKNNELILCAGKAGDIHIWDQESGVLLHHVRAQAHGGDLTCIAWNPAAEDPFMFATGSHDGAVRIWTRNPAGPPEEIPFRSSSPFELEEQSSTDPGTPLESMAESSQGGESGLSLRERVVAFAAQAVRDRPPDSSS